jgi:hypothetical protein
MRFSAEFTALLQKKLANMSESQDRIWTSMRASGGISETSYARQSNYLKNEGDVYVHHTASIRGDSFDKELENMGL